MPQIGGMALLVAKRIKGPRGTGALSPRAGDSHRNHILLCPTCHSEIDRNARAYSVEQLQAFKMRHEHWVAETLLGNIGEKTRFVQSYPGMVKQLEVAMHFHEWNWVIDHLYRDLAPADLIEDAEKVRVLSMKTVWPGSMPRVESSIRAVMDSWLAYCNHFQSAAHRSDNFLTASFIQRHMSFQERDKAAVKQQAWSNRNGELLLQYVGHLNWLINIVREELQPNYRQEDGYFLIHDRFGYRNDMSPITFRP